MILKSLLKTIKCSSAVIIGCLAFQHSHAAEVYNYYDFIKTRHLPTEIKTLVSQDEFIVDFSVGHVNSDPYWDVVLSTVSQSEFILAKQENRLPQQRTLQIFFNDGTQWSLHKKYHFLFRNEKQRALSSYYDFYSIGTDNLFYFSKLYKIYGPQSDDKRRDATGGVNLMQSFEKYGYEIRFVWDNDLNNLVYEGAVVSSYKNEENSTNEYYNMLNHTWNLAPEGNKLITIDKFFIQHPHFADTVNLNPEHYPIPTIAEDSYTGGEE